MQRLRRENSTEALSGGKKEDPERERILNERSGDMCIVLKPSQGKRGRLRKDKDPE